jgi:CCR4-NOT transcription complex subunit 3
MKKVDEGVELFDEIYEKVYTAEQQSEKEKYEVELKKEIKKLQRLRDQIKSWISGTEVKDKDGLLEYRRLIETKMEAFKVVEKETKTKTFSKEGLARADKLDPEEQKKEETIQWMGEVIEQLQTLIDEKDLEVVKLSAGKGKKTNKSQIEEYNHHLLSHKFHMSKLEGIMRLVRNDRIPADQVDDLKEDLEYYIDSHQEDDYMMAYDEDGFYESLGLDELDIVNVDRVTQANTATSKKKDDDATSASSGSKVEKNSKKTSAATGMIPLTIGRARSAKADKEKGGPTSSNEATPTKIGRSNSGISATNGAGGAPAPAVVGPTPTPKAPASPPGAGGASMAAVLRRESEERARTAQLLAQQQEQAALLQQQQAAEKLRQQQLQKQLQQQAETQRLQQAETLRQQLEAKQKAMAAAAQQAEALKRQQMMMEQRQAAAQMQQQQQDAAAKAKMLQQQQQQQQQQAQAAPQQVAQAQQQNVINAGLAGLSLGNVGPSPASTAPIASTSSAASNMDSTERYLNALNDSFLQMPTSTETERAKAYTPRNPYPAAPPCYPSTPSPILDNPAVFEKLGTDALFFIFYYAQGTYQQYLAARELKKQSWRYHKKYMTWFQRHEEPKVTTGDYEQGTYVYFDYETGWCQRIKSDFRFEYTFLEDSLSV